MHSNATRLHLRTRTYLCHVAFGCMVTCTYILCTYTLYWYAQHSGYH